MTPDLRSPGETRDPAFREMALHILAEALNCADRPATMSSRVVDQIRALTGARTVVLLQCLHQCEGRGHRIVGVDPERRRSLAESAMVDRLAELTHSLKYSVLWRSSEDGDPAGRILAGLGCGMSIATPLCVGSDRIGCLLLLDLPEDAHGVSQVVETLDMLSTVVALVFRTAILHETQEATIQERTRELASSNERLRGKILEREQAERERKKLIAQLEIQNAELERFCYTVSHDLKTPLITIEAFLGLLKEDLADGDAAAVEDDMTRVSSAAVKMARLLDDVLELSRIGRVVGPPEHVPLGDLARDAVELAGVATDKRKIQVEISTNLPTVFGDRSRLLEVLQNLVSNAVKYLGDQPRPRIEIGTRPRDGETVYYVQDNGMGIEPRYHEKIFALFDQLDNKAEGSGVGLAVVKRIIEFHGGRIWIESEGFGQGSTFCFTLPSDLDRTETTGESQSARQADAHGAFRK